jgi:hypothetical protein
MNRISRRRYLEAIGLGLLGVTTGCLGNGNKADDPSNSKPTNPDTPTDSGVQQDGSSVSNSPTGVIETFYKNTEFYRPESSNRNRLQELLHNEVIGNGGFRLPADGVTITNIDSSVVTDSPTEDQIRTAVEEDRTIGIPPKVAVQIMSASTDAAIVKTRFTYTREPEGPIAKENGSEVSVETSGENSSTTKRETPEKESTVSAQWAPGEDAKETIEYYLVVTEDNNWRIVTRLNWNRTTDN